MNYKYPKSRQSDLVEQELRDELLIFDLITNQALCLNKVSAFVWRNCDGARSPAEVARLLQDELKAPVDAASVLFAVSELAANNLMSEDGAAPKAYSEMSRRELVKTLGASAALALPVIFTVTTPTAAQTTSCVARGGSCTATAQCCTNVLNPGGCLVCDVGGTNTCVDGCVIYDTLILTKSGIEVRAADVFIGQELLGVDAINNSIRSGKVVKIKETMNRGIYSLTATNGETLQCSPAHQLVPDFAAPGKRVSDYKIGESLLIYDCQSGGTVKSNVAAMEFFDINQPVLTFKIETPNSTYLSGRMVSNG